jgi:hypothetical protein
LRLTRLKRLWPATSALESTGLFINLPAPFNFTINSDDTVSGTSGTNATGVTNGKKLFEMAPANPAAIRTFEQQ